MLILSAAEIRQALPMGETIAAMKTAYAAFSSGKAVVPLRNRLLVPPHEAVTLVMPAYLYEPDSEALAVKIVSVFPQNVPAGLPLIHAAVLVMEAGTGRPIALLEGGGLTAARTGAASGAATDILARGDSQVTAIFGAGVQGRTQLEAVCTVRPIQTAWIYDPDQRQVSQLIDELAGHGPIPSDLRQAKNPQEAVKNADVICCATTSQTPVFDDRHLRSGVHINAVGSYTEEMQEIPAETVQRAVLVVDSREAVLSETGDILKPIQSGLIDEGHIHAELGEIVLGQKSGRKDADQITLFKSVGLAVQDAAAAHLALETAQHLGLGQRVDW
jgi:ornithine cyclodeaminase/alanine dehydrogenase-like protein (mu-crystallin family)